MQTLSISSCWFTVCEIYLAYYIYIFQIFLLFFFLHSVYGRANWIHVSILQAESSAWMWAPLRNVLPLVAGLPGGVASSGDASRSRVDMRGRSQSLPSLGSMDAAASALGRYTTSVIPHKTAAVPMHPRKARGWVIIGQKLDVHTAWWQLQGYFHFVFAGTIPTRLRPKLWIDRMIVVLLRVGWHNTTNFIQSWISAYKYPCCYCYCVVKNW